ncbi:MAG: 50S ribosomal protein L21 [Buchnera aphidicola (Nurudea yanoniella)]
MYAIFTHSGKQYKAETGKIIKIEKLNCKSETKIQIKDILLISHEKKIIVKKKELLKSFILANVISHGRDKKINIIKFNRRKHYKKHQGHRQYFTKILITNICTKKE